MIVWQGHVVGPLFSFDFVLTIVFMLDNCWDWLIQMDGVNQLQ